MADSHVHVYVYNCTVELHTRTRSPMYIVDRYLPVCLARQLSVHFTPRADSVAMEGSEVEGGG